MMSTETDLIDTMDQLCEAQDLIIVAMMAVAAVTDMQHRNGLERLLGTISDRLTYVGEKLEARFEGEGK